MNVSVILEGQSNNGTLVSLNDWLDAKHQLLALIFDLRKNASCQATTKDIQYKLLRCPDETLQKKRFIFQFVPRIPLNTIYHDNFRVLSLSSRWKIKDFLLLCKLCYYPPHCTNRFCVLDVNLVRFSRDGGAFLRQFEVFLQNVPFRITSSAPLWLTVDSCKRILPLILFAPPWLAVNFSTGTHLCWGNPFGAGSGIPQCLHHISPPST